jgi:hypothetical protein
MKQSLPYIGFLFGDTPEIKAENDRRFNAAYEKYKEMTAKGAEKNGRNHAGSR